MAPQYEPTARPRPHRSREGEGRALSAVTEQPPRPAPAPAPAGPAGLLPDAAGPPAETLECAELAAGYGCRLTADQVWRLVALRHRYRAGGIPEPQPRADPRLRFARWLYLEGRISG
jgi:hypothetical protein